MSSFQTFPCMAIAVTLACTSACAAPAWAESAAQPLSRGEAKLAEADFQGAVEAFEAAAEQSGDEAMDKRLATLKKVVALRRQLQQEKDPSQWTRIARALHQYYHREKLFDVAETLDREIHARLSSALSAALLAQTLMAKGANDEAAALLAGIPEDQQGMGSKAMLAVALARAGKHEQAVKVAGAVPEPEHLCPGKAFLLARMQAAVGEEQEAAKLLGKAFAATPQTRVPMLRASAEQCPELAPLLKAEKYQALLAERSPATEHDDHDHDAVGGHCANCPSQARVEDLAAPKCDGACKRCKKAGACQEGGKCQAEAGGE